MSGENENTPALVFESRFECGNLAKAVQVRQNDYELWLRYDLYTYKHTQWYYFRVSNATPGVTYRFTIVNFMKSDSLYNMGMRPLVYSERDARDHGIGWLRTGGNIKYYRNNKVYETSKGDRSFYSLTWTTKFQNADDRVYFAHCYPYTYSNLQEYLINLSNTPHLNQICKQRVLCRTLAGNFVYVLTITSPSSSPEDARHKKAVVLTSRVHPGESNSSWMMKGFLDFLLSSSPDAQLLRNMFIFKIVPMLNPDGVIVGNYRCSLSGRDLNRNYKTKLKDAFPSVWYTRNMISRLLEEREVIVYCDLHGHSRKQNVFIYGCENLHNPLKRLRERIFPAMLGKIASDKFKFESCKFKIQKNKEGTGRVVMWNLGIMNSFTMEATFCGSSLGRRKGTHFNISDYEQMGFQFLDTLLDYCDPDGAKSNNILLYLEEKIKLDILAKMKVLGMNTDNIDLASIDLSSVLDESSDGGSDSSVSDGLPVHLKYARCLQNSTKKKKLKTRKERDKSRTKPVNEVVETVTPAVKPQLLPQPVINEPVRSRKKFPVSQHTCHNLRLCKLYQQVKEPSKQLTQIPCVLDNQKVSSEYLEELTSAYINNGLTLNNESGAYLRYASTKKIGINQDCNYDLCNFYDSGLYHTSDTNIQNMAFPGNVNESRGDNRACPTHPLAVFSSRKSEIRHPVTMTVNQDPVQERMRALEGSKITETRPLGDMLSRKTNNASVHSIMEPLLKKQTETESRQTLQLSTVKQQHRDIKQISSIKQVSPQQKDAECVSASNGLDNDHDSDKAVASDLLIPVAKISPWTSMKTDSPGHMKSQKLWVNPPPSTFVTTEENALTTPSSALTRIKGVISHSLSVIDTAVLTSPSGPVRESGEVQFTVHASTTRESYSAGKSPRATSKSFRSSKSDIQWQRSIDSSSLPLPSQTSLYENTQNNEDIQNLDKFPNTSNLETSGNNFIKNPFLRNPDNSSAMLEHEYEQKCIDSGDFQSCTQTDYDKSENGSTQTDGDKSGYGSDVLGASKDVGDSINMGQVRPKSSCGQNGVYMSQNSQRPIDQINDLAESSSNEHMKTSTDPKLNSLTNKGFTLEMEFSGHKDLQRSAAAHAIGQTAKPVTNQTSEHEVTSEIIKPITNQLTLARKNSYSQPKREFIDLNCPKMDVSTIEKIYSRRDSSVKEAYPMITTSQNGNVKSNNRSVSQMAKGPAQVTAPTRVSLLISRNHDNTTKRAKATSLSKSNSSVSSMKNSNKKRL